MPVQSQVDVGLHVSDPFIEGPLKGIECVFGSALMAASVCKDDRRGMLKKRVHGYASGRALRSLEAISSLNSDAVTSSQSWSSCGERLRSLSVLNDPSIIRPNTRKRQFWLVM